jgi:hypothetical protein
MTKKTFEEKRCNELGLWYSKYQEFMTEHHPDIDKNVELRKKYQTDEEWANHKVGLFDTHMFKEIVDKAAAENSTDILPQI